MQKRLVRAEARLRQGDLEGAERDLRKILDEAPGDAVAHNLMGMVHLERRNHPEALACFSNAIRLQSPYPEALINLSVACNRTGAHELALKACDLALTASPGNPLALINQGMAHKGLRQLPEARRAFELAGPGPMARFNLGHVLLLEKDLEHGLPLFELRREVLGVGAGLAGEPWTGESRPDATLLVIPEQGMGDLVLMSRFFTTLADRFARVIVQVPEPMQRLVASLDARLDVVTALEGRRWDLWAPVLSLPHLLGIRRLADVPKRPWIRANATDRSADRPRVGINWAGNPSYAYDAVRSTTLESLAPLLSVEGIEWVSLHLGVREHEADAFDLPQPLRLARDFMDTAEVIAGLDMVVSTETAIPNLSAAMGVPTCVLTVQDVDWRWNGWYPNVTVCTQREPGNWFGPIADVAGAILALAGNGAPGVAA